MDDPIKAALAEAAPLAPTCSACREPRGTCFPFQCKAYKAAVERAAREGRDG